MTVQNPGGNLTLFKGEYVCRMTWFNYVPYAPMWYTPSTTKVFVRMQHVLDGNVTLEPISEENQLPSNLDRATRREATAKGAVQIPDEDHDLLMDLGNQREGLDFEEDVLVNDEGDLVVEEEEESDDDEEDGSDDDSMEEDDDMEE